MNTTKKDFNKGNKTTNHRRHTMKTTTLDVYSHDTDNTEKQEVDTMNNKLFSEVQRLKKEQFLSLEKKSSEQKPKSYVISRSKMYEILASLEIIEYQAAKLSSLIKVLSATDTDEIKDPLDIAWSLKAAADIAEQLHGDIINTKTEYQYLPEAAY